MKKTALIVLAIVAALVLMIAAAFVSSITARYRRRNRSARQQLTCR